MNCPYCKLVILEEIKTNPPGGLQCPRCKKGYTQNPPGKIYKLKFTKSGASGSVSNVIEGTLEELIRYFQSTLETGHYHSKSVSTQPKTIQSLIKNVNKALATKGYTYHHEEVVVANPPEKKDMLVTYKGGGYTGCFWEWNFFIYDDEGKFVDIGSSGWNGITDEKTAEEYLKNEENRRGKDYFITDLNDPESVKEFVDETNEGNVLNVITEVNKHYGDEKMQFKCPECGQMATEGENTGYHGDGGIGITKTGLMCQECYMGHTCGYCGEYHDDQSELDIDDDSHCTYCKPDVEENPSKATLLKKEAKETATWRGHDMSNFTKRDRDFESTCKKCGMQMWVTPKPAPNEIDIVGEAVALGCGEKENPPADKHFVTGVNKETGKRHIVSRFMSLEECKEFIQDEPPNGGKGVWDKMRIKNWKTGEEVWSE